MTKLEEALQALYSIKRLAQKAIPMLEQGTLSPLAAGIALATVADMALLKLDEERAGERKALQEWGVAVARELGFVPVEEN